MISPKSNQLIDSIYKNECGVNKPYIGEVINIQFSKLPKSKNRNIIARFFEAFLWKIKNPKKYLIARRLQKLAGIK